MKIVVIQRHTGNLRGIKAKVAKINSVRAEEIIYTSNPKEVIEAVRGDEPALVISGQVLDLYKSGTDLASIVKRVNPNTLFYIYSVMPETNEAIDGVIPKEDGTLASGEHSLIARILTSNLDGATREKITAMLLGI